MTHIRIPRSSFDKPGDKLWDREYPRKRPDLDFQSMSCNEDDYFEPLPRPKTCAWERGWLGPYYVSDCMGKFPRSRRSTCPSCKRPITFTEAK